MSEVLVSESILNSVKQFCGYRPDYDVFDSDFKMLINSDRSGVRKSASKSRKYRIRTTNLRKSQVDRANRPGTDYSPRVVFFDNEIRERNVGAWGSR